MSMYLGIKHLHTGLILISILGFIGRGGWLLATGERPANKLVRIAPHVIDTLLLLSGITLLAVGSGVLLTQPWMLLKLVFVALYIGLGIAAFKTDTLARRWLFFALALLVFAQTVGIALNKSMAGWLLPLF